MSNGGSGLRIEQDIVDRTCCQCTNACCGWAENIVNTGPAGRRTATRSSFEEIVNKSATIGGGDLQVMYTSGCGCKTVQLFGSGRGETTATGAPKP